MAVGDKAFTGSIPAIYDEYLVPIWFAPYADDLVRRLGWANAAADGAGRYPHAEVADILAAGGGVDAVLLPDEPYPFGPDDGPEAFPAGTRTVPVPGRALFWYGPAMIEARGVLEYLVG